MLNKSKFYLLALFFSVFLPTLLINLGLIVDDSAGFVLLFLSFAACAVIPFVYVLKNDFSIVFALISILCSVITPLLLLFFDPSFLSDGGSIEPIVIYFALSAVGTAAGCLFNQIKHFVKNK